ncbi:FeoB-associated Cys-rich membrane protein [Planctomicrobium sp. SH527]|uniref:FeoB-associated Cys-rich membrane protein n=1 Tax=Planctomicrobium sp. SH527 TaxID=3448123 RepID=UPI003F5B69EF
MIDGIIDWQTLITAGIVVMAAILLIRNSWRSLTGSSAGCGSKCSGCPSNTSDTKDAQRSSIVSLEDFTKSSGKKR